MCNNVCLLIQDSVIHRLYQFSQWKNSVLMRSRKLNLIRKVTQAAVNLHNQVMIRYSILLSDTYKCVKVIVYTFTDNSDEEVWESSEVDDFNDTSAGSGMPPSTPTFNNASPDSIKASCLLQWLVMYLLSLQAKYTIPDSAIDMLFRFLYIFFSILARFSPFVAIIAGKFPQSKCVAQKYIGIEVSFTKFVLCPTCFKTHLFNDTWQKVGSLEVSKRCTFVHYPNHPHPSRRSPCNTLLLKTVELSSGRKVLYPRKIYCYNSLSSSLQELLLRPGFVEECNHWRDRPCSNMIRDVYDGKIWKKFLNVEGSPFLAGPFSYALILNIDWFQPYSHTVASVGVVYLAIMNLPRHLRYKRKNMLLIGIIPGPSEPSHDVNTFLQPLVLELKDLWQGISLNVYRSAGISNEVLVRCALLCVACDLPAGRKVCGFLSHCAAKGCSKCYKVFSGGVSSMCYAGFDRSLWRSRNNTLHRRDVEEVMKCNTKTERAKKEADLGVRYSALLDLSYFDPPSMLAIDPMHNLFLGTGKRMISIWIKEGLLDSTKFEEIQHSVDGIIVLCDVGRIPRKIETGFSGFKADQFKTWIMIYSIPSLFGILPREHLQCWRYFVLACRILCHHQLSLDQLDLADALLMKFCQTVENIYGTGAITPNMHLHGHLKEIMLDYGPMQEFWLFSFERYNGILGKQPTNNRLIEAQLMHRFLRDNKINSLSYPDEFGEDFFSICEDIRVNRLASWVSFGYTLFRRLCTANTLYMRCVNIKRNCCFGAALP